MNNSMEVIAAMFLIRERDACSRGENAVAVAYANAFDLLCYAIDERDDCLCQFDSYDEANKFINSTNYKYLWEMEELFKK